MVHHKLPTSFAVSILLIIILIVLAVGVIQGGKVKLTGDTVRVYARITCAEGAFRCSDDMLQTCRSGNWANQEFCEDGCRNNACIADATCTEDSYRCLGDYRQRCGGGAWVNEEKCPAGCIDGRCVSGSQCRQGEYRCSGNYMQGCVYGTWFNKARCKSGCRGDSCEEFISKRSCTDEDKGKDYSRRAETYGIDRHDAQYSMTDHCIADQDLVEYSCQQGYLIEDKFLCSGRCANGACVTEDIAISAAENVVSENAAQDVVIEEPAPLPAAPVTGRINYEGFWAKMWGWLRGFFAEMV